MSNYQELALQHSVAFLDSYIKATISESLQPDRSREGDPTDCASSLVENAMDAVSPLIIRKKDPEEDLRGNAVADGSTEEGFR